MSIEEQLHVLTQRIEALEHEKIKFGKVKTVTLTKDNKYLLFIPADLFSLIETQRFAEVLKQNGFQVVVARVPDARGIKAVEKE